MSLEEKYRIPVEKLRWSYLHTGELNFCESSRDVPPLQGIIGQDRAVKSMDFGLGMAVPGYNIFVSGPPGTGKSTYVQTVVSRLAEKGNTPDDWCYIYNFTDRDKPIAVSLPAGQGKIFRNDMTEFVEDMRSLIPKTFESSDYDQQKGTIIQVVQEKVDSIFRSIEQEALKAGFIVRQAPGRVALIPIRDGKQLSPEEYKALSAEERKIIDENTYKLEKRLDEIIRGSRALEKEADKQLKELDRQITRFATEPPIARLKEKYAYSEKILDYLDKVLTDITENNIIFRLADAPQAQNPFQLPESDGDPFIKYKVNLFVNNENSKGAPAIIEPFTNYYNIFGKIEYKNQFMYTTTDFTMVKAGAIHQANGGYLVLQAKDVLFDPFMWDALKKVLKHQQALIENIGEQYRYVPTLTLKPETIPLNVKIILIGSPIFYKVLTYDEDFRKLFKVKVDFDISMERNEENIRKYVSFISSICEETGTLHFDRSGLGKVIEYGSRLAGNQTKLSTQFNEITEIVHESSAIAKYEEATIVSDSHVRKALADRKYRANMIEEKFQEMLLKDKIMIDIKDEVIGQVNGLSVIQTEEYAFGHPTRITARTYIGSNGVTNIERETKMSGSSHSKGVLTLAGFLGGQFAQEKPLAVSAQLTFEQNYGGVDGDSASSAELYALLSSLADVPLKQNLAVTGSINQKGEIQPIGGATEKIESFFDLCEAKGLNGEQGVIIPNQNVDDLMLKEEIIAAVEAAKFHIYSVKTVAEGIELLTGMNCGKREPDGTYTQGSIFHKVQQKLEKYNQSIEAAQIASSQHMDDNASEYEED